MHAAFLWIQNKCLASSIKYIYLYVYILWMYFLHTNFPPSQDFSWLCFKNPRLTSVEETCLRLKKLLSWKKELWQHLQSWWDKKGKVDSGGRNIETVSVSGSKTLKGKTAMWKKLWRKKKVVKENSGKDEIQKASRASLGAFTWLGIFLTWPHCWSLAISPWSLWVSHGERWRLSTVTFSLALY